MIKSKHGFDVLLEGIVGSQAYGLAGPDSDEDRLAVGAIPTELLFGLREIKESHVATAPDPDYTIHEARKFCALALRCNPTVTELMWLEDYTAMDSCGESLLEIRQAFLSADRVREAYLGYATAQFQRLIERGDGSFSSDTRKRTAKHARHMMRLVMQGYRLYRTGELVVRVAEPEALLEFGERVAAGDLDLAEKKLGYYEDLIKGSTSALPPVPEEAVVSEWLREVRHAHLGRQR